METLDYYEISNSHWKVVAEYIGEGNDGDYDENDPSDQPLMRYDFWRVGNNTQNAIEESEDSYCTLIPNNDPDAIRGMASIFLDALDDSTIFPKHWIQKLTWTTPEEASEFFRGQNV